MKARCFTEAPIITILKECKAGATGKEICRRHGICEQTLIAGKPSSVGCRGPTPDGS